MQTSGADLLGVDGDEVVPLPVLDEGQGLQGGHDVVRPDGGAVADLLDGQVVPVRVQRVQDHARPVAAVADLQCDSSSIKLGAVSGKCLCGAVVQLLFVGACT